MLHPAKVSDFCVQTSSVAALFGTPERAGPAVLGLHEEHHSELAEAGTNAHKGEENVVQDS